MLPVHPLLMIHSLLRQQTDILISASIYRRHFQSFYNKVEQGRTDDPVGPSVISSVSLHRTGFAHTLESHSDHIPITVYSDIYVWCHGSYAMCGTKCFLLHDG